MRVQTSRVQPIAGQGSRISPWAQHCTAFNTSTSDLCVYGRAADVNTCGQHSMYQKGVVYNAV